MFLCYLAYNMVAMLTGYSGIVHEWCGIKNRIYDYARAICRRHPIRGADAARRPGVITGSRYAEDVEEAPHNCTILSFIAYWMSALRGSKFLLMFIRLNYNYALHVWCSTFVIRGNEIKVSEK